MICKAFRAVFCGKTGARGVPANTETLTQGFEIPAHRARRYLVGSAYRIDASERPKVVLPKCCPQPGDIPCADATGAVARFANPRERTEQTFRFVSASIQGS